MPATPVGIIVDPNGSTSSITITAASGNAVTAYTSQGGSSTHTFPVSISVPTEFWLVQPAQYTLTATGSAGANGEGGNLTVDLRGGGVQSVQLGVVDDGDPDKGRLERESRAAYVATAPPPSGVVNGVADTSALQTLIDAAAAAGGGQICLHDGIYWVTGLVIKAGVVLQGFGHGVTIVKLAAGANTDVIQGYGFAALTTGATLGGIQNPQVRDLTIDGNKAAQTVPTPTITTSSLGNPFNLQAAAFTITLSDATGLPAAGSFTLNTLSGPATVSYTGIAGSTLTGVTSTSTGRVNSAGATKIFPTGHGLRWYAYNYDLVRVEIQNCVADGFWTEWGNGQIGSGSEMESRATDCKMHDNGRNGVSFLGPHDSYFSRCVWWRNAELGYVDTGYATAYVTDCHGWGSPQKISFETHSGSQFHGCTAEVTAASNSRGYRIFTSCVIKGGSVFAPGATGGLVGIELQNNATDCDIDTQIRDCTTAAVLFTGDGGRNRIRVQIKQASGTAYSGTIHATTTFTPTISGGVSVTAPTVASAAAITLPSASDFIEVTGTTQITSIAAASTVLGRRVTLRFSNAAPGGIANGNNLRLAGSFAATQDDTITLACDGTNWYEVSRAAVA